MSRLYLDACTIIYGVEATTPFHEAVVNRLLAFNNDPKSALVTSRLSLLECRVRPIRYNDEELLATYDAFFSGSRLEIIEISAPVIERATTVRARYGFATPDAIHLASAIEGGADIFLTGDAVLTRCKEVKVEVLSAAEP